MVVAAKSVKTAGCRRMAEIFRAPFGTVTGACFGSLQKLIYKRLHNSDPELIIDWWLWITLHETQRIKTTNIFYDEMIPNLIFQRRRGFPPNQSSGLQDRPIEPCVQNVHCHRSGWCDWERLLHEAAWTRSLHCGQVWSQTQTLFFSVGLLFTIKDSF